MISPDRLLDSARQLYGEDMDRMWGEMLPVPEENVRPLNGGESLFGGEFEVGRPPGLKPGTPLDFPVAVNSTPLPLEPGRYEWRLTIDGATREDWTMPFSVRTEET